MSSSPRDTDEARKGTQPSDSGPGYTIGYGKPPPQHQYRPGQSGNPKGRPKGRKNAKTLLNEIVNRKVELRTGGVLRKVTILEVVLTRFVDAALKGDTKAAAFVMQLHDAMETDQEHTNDVTPMEDRIIIEEFGRILRKNGNEEK